MSARDPLDELRRANPIDPVRLPSDSSARLWARIEEATMEEQSQRAGRRWRAWPFALGGVAVAGAVALTLFFGSANTAPNGGGGGVAETQPPRDPGTGAASCVEMYSLDTLANRSWAFDGTVTAIDGDEVTFAVNGTFRGNLGREVTLSATGMTGTSVTSAGGPNLVVGERYLVAGEENFVWSCGFTQPYDADTAAQWADSLD